MPTSYQRTDLKATLKSPPELQLPRPLLQRLLAARSGHGDFEEYHDGVLDFPERITPCNCGQSKTPTHIFSCRAVKKEHHIRLRPSTSAISPAWQAIGSRFEQFIQIAKTANVFTEICPTIFVDSFRTRTTG